MSGENYQGVFDNTIKAIALLSSLSFIFSFLYDWGFYSSLGLTFREIPTSIADHVRSSLLWLPFAIGFVFCCVAGIFAALNDITPADGSPQKKRKQWDEAIIDSLIFVFATAVFILYILVTDRVVPLVGLAAIFMWGFICKKMLLKHRAFANLSRQKLALLYFTPIFLLAIFFAGHMSGYFLYNSVEYKTSLRLSDSSSHKIVYLRNFEKGILYKNMQGVVVYKPWEQISEIETQGRYTSHIPLICYAVQCEETADNNQVK